MITTLTAYIKTIVALTIFSTLANMMMPDNEFKKYTQLVVGFLILSTVMTPLFRFFVDDFESNELFFNTLEKSWEGNFNSNLDIETYENMEKETVITAYNKELSTRILQDLQKQGKEVFQIEVNFNENIQEENFGELEKILVYCYKDENLSEIQVYTAKRYGLHMDNVVVLAT